MMNFIHHDDKQSPKRTGFALRIRSNHSNNPQRILKSFGLGHMYITNRFVGKSKNTCYITGDILPKGKKK